MIYYFPRCLPSKFRTSDSMYVPREDIPQFGGQPQAPYGKDFCGKVNVRSRKICYFIFCA
jgi:hypothetical protein